MPVILIQRLSIDVCTVTDKRVFDDFLGPFLTLHFFLEKYQKEAKMTIFFTKTGLMPESLQRTDQRV